MVQVDEELSNPVLLKMSDIPFDKWHAEQRQHRLGSRIGKWAEPATHSRAQNYGLTNHWLTTVSHFCTASSRFFAFQSGTAVYCHGSFPPWPVSTRTVRTPARRPASTSCVVSPIIMLWRRSISCSCAASRIIPGSGFLHAHFTRYCSKVASG